MAGTGCYFRPAYIFHPRPFQQFLARRAGGVAGVGPTES